MFKNTLKLGMILLISLPIGYGLVGFIFGILGTTSDIWIDWDRIVLSVQKMDKAILFRDAIFSVKVAVFSTLISLIFCYFLALYAFYTKRMILICVLMVGVFIIPHPTYAILLEQIFSESSLLGRVLFHFKLGSKEELPSATSIFNHSSAVIYILAMAIKEAPFLWFILLASSYTHAYQQQIKVAQSLGYNKSSAIIWFIFPQMYKHLSMPLLAVIIFVIGHVEMALLIAPFEPETLGVKILTLFNEANLISRHQAFLIGLGLIILSFVSILLFQLIIFLSRKLFFSFVLSSIKQLPVHLLIRLIPVLIGIIGGMLICGLLGLLVLSFATFWPFPARLPEGGTLVHWVEVSRLGLPLLTNTLFIAFVSVSFSLIIVVGLIELTYKSRMAAVVSLILSFPLLVPMLGFLLGVLLLINQFNLSSLMIPVILGHMLYMMPYFYFILARPFTEFDRRWIYTSKSLGKSGLSSYFCVKLRFMFTPLLFTILLGFIISFNQYLPTLLLGGGQVETLNSQAIIFAQGGSKRLLASYALLQIALAFVIVLIGWLIWWNSRERNLHGKLVLG